MHSVSIYRNFDGFWMFPQIDSSPLWNWLKIVTVWKWEWKWNITISNFFLQRICKEQNNRLKFNSCSIFPQIVSRPPKIDENDWKMLFLFIFAFSSKFLGGKMQKSNLKFFSVENKQGVKVCWNLMVFKYFKVPNMDGNDQKYNF